MVRSGPTDIFHWKVGGEQCLKIPDQDRRNSQKAQNKGVIMIEEFNYYQKSSCCVLAYRDVQERHRRHQCLPMNRDSSRRRE